jgi:hypothetical protein
MKKPIITTSLVLSLAITCVAQSRIVNCIAKKNAAWNEASSWQNETVPSEENEMAIVNGTHSAIVDDPVEAPIEVQVGNGKSAPLDGKLTINSDFRVKSLGVAVADGTTGRLEQNAGIISVEELTLSAMGQETLEATYDLIGGSLEAEVLKMGISGPANLNVEGNGKVVSVGMKLQVGAQSAIRLIGTKAGFPTLNAATAHITIEPGATLTVEGAGAATKTGKFTLIEANEPLAGKLDVNLADFVAGKATVLENEPGVVIEVK